MSIFFLDIENPSCSDLVADIQNQKYPGIFTDIHTHILPEIDDGADSIEQTMEMLEQAYSEGIRVMFATPHYSASDYDYDDGLVLDTLDQVRTMARNRFPDMKILFGNEIYYSQGVAAALKHDKARTLGNSLYALIEFSPSVEEAVIERAVSEFTLYGFYPVLAHVERYECLKNKTDKVRELIDCGAYLQVNCRSLIAGKRKRWARKLLKDNLIHFVASDCHDTGRRKPIFGTAVDYMIKKIGEENTKKIVRDNIIKLLKNEVL